MRALVSERAYLARNYLEGLIYHRTDLHIIDESLNVDTEAQTVNNYNAPKARFHIHRNKENGTNLRCGSSLQGGKRMNSFIKAHTWMLTSIYNHSFISHARVAEWGKTKVVWKSLASRSAIHSCLKVIPFPGDYGRRSKDPSLKQMPWRSHGALKSIGLGGQMQIPTLRWELKKKSSWGPVQTQRTHLISSLSLLLPLSLRQTCQLHGWNKAMESSRETVREREKEPASHQRELASLEEDIYGLRPGSGYN